MFKQHERVHLAALQLVEAADRVRSGATRGEKYAWLNGMLTRLSSSLEPVLAAQLRVACYERLFDSEDSAPA